MSKNEWVLKTESATENIYQIKNSSSEYLRVCTPKVNEQLNEKFELFKQNLSVGFYQIKDIHPQKKYNSDEDENAARVSYKENLDKKFVDMGMSIRLQPLFNFVSECLNGNKLEFKKNPAGLIDEIIHIESCDLVDSTYNGKTLKVNKVKWSILNYQAKSGGHLSDEEIIGDFFDAEDFEPEEEFSPEDLEPEHEFCPEDLDPEDEFYPEDFAGEEE